MTLTEAYRQSALISAAYAMIDLSDPTTVPLPPGFTMVQILLADDFGLGVSPFGIVAEDQDGRLVLGFRGSVTWQDWIEDFRFAMGPAPAGVGRTEQGFTSVADSITPYRGATLVKGIDRALGHSLGAPAVTIFAGQNGIKDLGLLASPEAGDSAFATWAGQQMTILNIQNPHDVVPDAPGRWLGYRDVGTITHLPFGYAPPIAVEQIAFNHSATNYRTNLATLAAA